jgi:hypothetical protein
MHHGELRRRGSFGKRFERGREIPMHARGGEQVRLEAERMECRTGVEIEGRCRLAREPCVNRGELPTDLGRGFDADLATRQSRLPRLEL